MSGIDLPPAERPAEFGAPSILSLSNPPLTIHLLGNLRLEGVRGVESAGFENRHHVRAALALVASSRRGVVRDELMEILWPQSNAAAARNRLYHTVHLARQSLAALAWDDEWVAVRQGHVVLDERVWCDAQQLEATAECSDAELTDQQLHNAMPLCFGDWMPDLDIGAVGDSLRARVRTWQGLLLRKAVTRHAVQGDTPAQRALLQSLLRIEPTDEWAYRELMRLDLAAGRRHAVLRTFETVGRELSEQLGLKPTAETCAIASTASAELQSKPLSGAGGFEPGTPSLVGREPLILELVSAMAQQAGVWNLTGLSGIGKTTLACEVARRVAPSMADGVCIVNLGSLGPNESTAAACVRALGLVAAPQQEQRTDLDLLLQALTSRQMILLLDDLDAAADAQELLLHLPKTSALSARVMVTTRTRISIAHATVVPVKPLQTPELGMSLGQAMQSASFALFQMRCPVMNTEQHFDRWRHDAVELVRRLDGLPLAIELAAARTATMTPGEILVQIERTLSPLAEVPAGSGGRSSSRHRSLQASLDWSVHLLSEAARSAYGAIAIFPGHFSPHDVRSLMATVGLDAALTDVLLQELVSAGLLAKEPTHGRLYMLHLPRAHAKSQAQSRGQWPAVVAARLEEVCRVLQTCPLDYESPKYTAHLQRVIEIEADATALLEHARTHEPERFVRMLVTLCEAWGVRGTSSSVLRWAEPAIECARQLGLVEAELWLRLRFLHSMNSSHGPAGREHLHQAMLPLLARVTDKNLACRVALARALTLAQTGHMQHAIDLLMQTLERLDLKVNQPGFWSVYARLLIFRNPPPDIELDLSSLRNRFGGSPLWHMLLEGACQDFRGGEDWIRRYAISEELVSCARALHSPVLVLNSIGYRAACQSGLDETSAALRSLDEAYRLARNAGLTQLAAGVRINLASLCWRILDLDAASHSVNEAAELLEPTGHDEVLRISIAVHRAIILALRGQTTEAVQAFCTVPDELLPHLSDDLLIYGAEACALLAPPLGFDEAGAELVGLLRKLDARSDFIPAIRRFRDERFGPFGPDEPLEPEAVNAVRMRLRLCLQEMRNRMTAI
jgi:DNA-binding SARP family transcriptional activator/predicted ATPase